MTTLHEHRTYEDLLRTVYMAGERRTDRTGVGTVSLFGPDPLRYDLSDRRLALITSKQVAWKMALREFLWMLSGSTDVNELRKSSPAMADIWDNWATNGDIGPTYGAQYREAGQSYDTYGRGEDQLERVIRVLTETPDSRRALISLWSPRELDLMGIEPCMVTFQFSLRGPKLNELELHVYQRSADLMLGVPFDLFQASLLAHLVARELTIQGTNHVTAKRLIWSAGDVHIYANHRAAAEQQLIQARDMPRMNSRLILPNSDQLSILDGSLTAGHIDVENYLAAPGIRAGAIAV